MRLYFSPFFICALLLAASLDASAIQVMQKDYHCYCYNGGNATATQAGLIQVYCGRPNLADVPIAILGFGGTLLTFAPKSSKFEGCFAEKKI